MNFYSGIKTALAVLLLMCGGSWPMESRAQQSNEILVSYSLESWRLVLHEPVALLFRIKSDSDQAVQVDLGSNRKGSFLLTITRPDGGRQALPRYVRYGLRRLGRVSIDPGVEYEQQLLVDEWYDFKLEGVYKIEVRLSEPVKDKAGAVITEAPPFNARLEFLPRDPARLRKVCQALVERIQKAQSYEEAADAANVLRYVRDPGAVPYLEEILYADRMVDGFATSGLKWIGTPEAINVLLAALESPHHRAKEPLQWSVFGVLAALAHETDDPLLKTRIEEALERGRQKRPE